MSRDVKQSVSIVVSKVDGWSVAFSAADDELMVRDVDLAERLGFERPRVIRELIDRHVSSGNLNDYEVRRTVRQTSPQGGRPGTEYWLTEAAALFIAAKSDTTAAVAITKELIHVFMMARRGQLPAQQPVLSEELVALLADRVAANVLAKLEEKPVTGTVGAPGGREIRAKLRRYGYLMAGSGETKEVRSWRSSGDTELRAKLAHTGAGSSWDELPMGMLASARRVLDEMLKRAQRVAGSRAQMDLPIPPPPKAA